jgi:fumarate reductase subunit D
MARSAKAVPWFLFAAGGTVASFILPVIIFLTGLSVWLFPSAFSYETMKAFLSWWIIKLILFGIVFLFLWHAAHRLRICAHDFGIRADTAVAFILYGFAALGTAATFAYIIRI